MRKIKPEDISDGMIVAKLIEDRLGRAILKPGDQLKVSFATRLSKWGVEEIWVEGGDSDQSLDQSLAEQNMQTVASATSMLNQKFAAFDEDSHMILIKKITQHYLADPRLQKHLR